MDNSPLFYSDAFYLIQNYGIAEEKIFKSECDYDHFLKLHDFYMQDYWKLAGWCLLPGSYHIIVKIIEQPTNTMTDLEKSLKISRVFGNFIAAYAKEINHSYQRKGNLFVKNVKRYVVMDDEDLRKKIIHVHSLPVLKSYVQSPFEWKYSSIGKLTGRNLVHQEN
jgi:hypothetical protein